MSILLLWPMCVLLVGAIGIYLWISKQSRSAKQRIESAWCPVADLSPTPKFKAFDNNGKPLNGGLLFTYEAGTSTKLATYVDSSGVTPNANPVVLDYRGECNLWIPPNIAYKYVLAPFGDTDPPTNPIWSVDDIVNSQLITLYGGVDTGSVNAYVLNFTANFSSYVDGTIIYWIPSNTNTGPSTLNVNGLGAVGILDASGFILGAGDIVQNQITAVIYRTGNFYLLSVSVNSGSFTGTLTGYAVNPTGTVFYKIAGGSCTLFVTSTISATSNATTLGMTGVPAICWPSSVFSAICESLIDNGSPNLVGTFSITSGGVVSFGIARTDSVVNFVRMSAVGFTNLGGKGLLNGWSVTYPL